MAPLFYDKALELCDSDYKRVRSIVAGVFV